MKKGVNLLNKNVPSGFRNAMADAFKEVEATQVSVKTTGRTVKTISAVLMCITLVSITAFAANEIYNKWFKKTGEYSGKISTEDVSFQKAPEYVNFEFEYLPESFTVFEAPYKYNYNGGFGISFNLWKMSSVDTNKYKNIIATEETIFGGNQAQILTINGSEAKLALIYFEDMGTVVECYYNKNIPQEEIKNVLDGLRLVETTQNNALTYDGTNENTSQPWVDDTQLPVNVCESAFDYDIASGAQYKVKIVESRILDDISEIDENCMRKEFVSEFADENGKLKSYERKNIVHGDGINTLDYVESVETVGRKVIALTYEIENVNNIAGQLDCSFVSCNKNLDLKDTRPFAISGQDGESNWFYFVHVGANEKKTVTTYSVVDDDTDFNDLYVFMEHHNIFGEQTKQDIIKIEF